MKNIISNIHKGKNGKFLQMAESGNSCCEKSNNSCCDDSSLPTGIHLSTTPGSITIDGHLVEVTQNDKNIVDVASRAKIGIPAACYRVKRKNGCCHGCVVEIDGEQKFACATVPMNGMNVIVNREDLKAIRKKNLLEYNEGIKSGNFCKCSVTGSSDCSC
ncbi:MAG: 2Fe-2S iron-sulfur cluster-binding protein [Desulfobulbaceae bacterium]|nr:2Fe-2S iron-sulfur cluster-binding protein [Desulfobulbaceae bacterium]